MKRVHGILQSLQDMKRAIGVTFLVSVAAELPHKGTRPGTETLTISYIADQKAQGSAQRMDLEKTQMAVEGLAKLKNRTRQMTTKQFNIDNGWTDDNKQQCGRDKVHCVEHVYAHFQKNRGKFQSEFPWWQLEVLSSSFFHAGGIHEA
ncbi:hypothetical protein WJX77_010123 [Trebouxia sp. C0004]